MSKDPAISSVWSSTLERTGRAADPRPQTGSDRRLFSVLIVEDEILIAMDLEMQLEAAGHRVVALASTADEAVAAAEAHTPDVALMDLRLADGSSGIDAGHRLYTLQGIRCIYMSGNLSPATRATLAPLRPYAMVSKPATPTQLTRALECIQSD